MPKKNKLNHPHPPKDRLFTESDAKSVELSGYTLGHGAPQYALDVEDYSIPTGVVDIDESVVLPQPSFNRTDSKPPSQSPSKGTLKLPPINAHVPSQDLYQQPSDRYAQHFYSTQDRLCRKHQHREENYDPRWWYMPLNSVHGPKRVHQYREHRYVPPKWYELSTRR